MASRIEKVVHQKIETNGEITINLVLTIKLDGNNLTVDSEVADKPVKKPSKMKVIDIDDEPLFIPEIQNGGIIDFGNKTDN